MANSQAQHANELAALLSAFGITEAYARKTAKAAINAMLERAADQFPVNVLLVALKEGEKHSELQARIQYLPKVLPVAPGSERENLDEAAGRSDWAETYGALCSPDTESEQDFTHRSEKATKRWQHLVKSITSILTSSDQADLEALEEFMCKLRDQEQRELIGQYKSMAFLKDDPLSKQAKIHAEFQKAISEEFQFFTPTELGAKLGIKKQSARQKVHRWINSGELFTVQDGKDLIPEFEIDWENKKPNLLIRKTIDAFSGNSSGWGIAYWMCQINELLDGLRPVDVLVDNPDEYLYALSGLNRGLHN